MVLENAVVESAKQEVDARKGPAPIFAPMWLRGQIGEGVAEAHGRVGLSVEHVERRLTAILAADIAGYSLLMGNDEEGTLAQLKALRHALVDRKINEHHGRIVKTTGDGMLVEFASVVEAVRCAVEIQRGMAERNVAAPAGQRIEFRVGINVGDIIIEGDDIFGQRGGSLGGSRGAWRHLRVGPRAGRRARQA